VIGRALEWILPGERADRVIYGVILVGALLAAEDGVRETYLDSVLSALIATAIYWLAHSYAALLGRRLSTGDHLTLATLWRGLAKEATLLKGAALPVLVLLICWASGAREPSAVDAALWSSVDLGRLGGAGRPAHTGHALRARARARGRGHDRRRHLRA
jgi:hypothetical protein